MVSQSFAVSRRLTPALSHFRKTWKFRIINQSSTGASLCKKRFHCSTYLPLHSNGKQLSFDLLFLLVELLLLCIMCGRYRGVTPQCETRGEVRWKMYVACCCNVVSKPFVGISDLPQSLSPKRMSWLKNNWVLCVSWFVQLSIQKEQNSHSCW